MMEKIHWRVIIDHAVLLSKGVYKSRGLKEGVVSFIIPASTAGKKRKLLNHSPFLCQLFMLC